MANTDVELEQQLKEVGRKLLHPPDSVDVLLPLLDQVERLLSKAEQSPKKTMLDALKPSMKALIQNDLLRHSDVDVKVAVASCISEITRITAPDAPYDDDQMIMRDVFQLIVPSFEDLADQSGRSYIKRASILETVSKVRSCVNMLDLECDGMIVEMFEHYLRSVRCVTTLTSILHLILCHANRHAVEMLKPLLATVKKHNEGVLPISQKLGEEVPKKSADKLKPYLMPALTALGDSLDTYTEILTRLCEGTTTAMKRDDEHASGQQPANESKLAKGSQDETQQADDRKITTSSSDHVDQVDNEVEKNSTMATIDSSSDSDLKPQKQAGKKAVFTKEVKRPATIDLSSDSDLNPEKQAGKKAVFAKEIKRPATIELSSHSDLNPQKQGGKKAVFAKEIKGPATIDSSSDSDLNPQKQAGKKAVFTKEVKCPATIDSSSDSDLKPQKQAGKKALTKEVKLPATIDSSGDDEATSDSDEETPPKISKKLEPVKPLKFSAKKGNAKKGNSKKKDDGRKRASGKNVIKKDEAKTLSSDNEMDVSPKSAKKPAKGEGNLKDTSGTSVKRKRTPVQDKESDTIKYDESLVGKKVKVWWPEDIEFYEGVIESFDAAKKKHKVSYVDGDEENLYLKNQRWAIIQKFSVRDKEQTAEVESEEASPEIHKKKKSKADPAPSASQEKNKDSSKKSKASGSKDNKSKVGKLKEAEDTPKPSTKTKQDTSKTSKKSKGKTPQSGSKANGPNKAKEPENVVKTPEKVGQINERSR